MSNKEYLRRAEALQRQYEREKPNGCLTVTAGVVLLSFCWLVYQIVFNGF